jgi:hypothetical protein
MGSDNKHDTSLLLANPLRISKEGSQLLFVQKHSEHWQLTHLANLLYEENVVTSFKSNLLLIIFWLHIINYNS